MYQLSPGMKLLLPISDTDDLINNIQRTFYEYRIAKTGLLHIMKNPSFKNDWYHYHQYCELVESRYVSYVNNVDELNENCVFPVLKKLGASNSIDFTTVITFDASMLTVHINSL